MVQKRTHSKSANGDRRTDSAVMWKMSISQKNNSLKFLFHNIYLTLPFLDNTTSEANLQLQMMNLWKKLFLFHYRKTKECRSTVIDETLYLTMLSAVTPTQWVFYIISVLPHIHIFTACLAVFNLVYNNLGITKSSLCCRIDSKLQFSGSYVKISWEMASEIS